MRPYFAEKFGNAGSLHSFGQEAMAAVDGARETVARAVGADFRGVLFAGSATEANNMALRGVLGRRPWTVGHKVPRIIISSIEHESVLETARDLEKDGIEIVHLPVNKSGVVDLKKLKESLTPNTVLVSVMYVNNETGSIQPIKEISEIIKEFRESRAMAHGPWPMACLHADAVQAFQYLDCDLNKLGVDLLTVSAHKIYGPKGIAALYSSQEQSILHPIISGGGQEFGLRSGTENVPAIVGFAKATEIAAAMRKEEAERIGKLKEYFWNGIRKICSKAEINGPAVNGPAVPHILNIYFPGYEVQDSLTRLDLAGVAASSGSACRSRAMKSSYVLTALGYSKRRALASVRFSFGRGTTKGELDKVLRILGAILS
jgi:cysteine desulfurase